MENNQNEREKINISVFFPLYNEEKNINKLTDTAVKIFSEITNDFEILLINDGSTDKTEALAKKLDKKYPQVRLISQKNKGYGGALKTGFKNAQYDWIFFSDGDLQFDLNEIETFLPFTKSYDLIIGFRKNRAEGVFRYLITQTLRVWNKIFLNFPMKIRDIDCAFKLIRKSVIDDIKPIKSNGAMVSTEFLLKIINKGYKIKQIGVSHFERKYGNSSGSDGKVILKAIKETFMLRQIIR